MKIDCLIIGHNEMEFSIWENTLKSYGEDSGAYKDLSLAFIQDEGQPYRAMDLINRFSGDHDNYHNFDFLQPAIYTLGTYLKQQGFSFDYINNFHLEKDSLEAILKEHEVLCIAITTTFYVSSQPLVEIVEFIRQYNQHVKIVIGGPFIGGQIAQSDPNTLSMLFDYFGADFWVNSSEGEQTLSCIIEVLKEGGDFKAIPNIVFKHQGELCQTILERERNELKENLPQWQLFNKTSKKFSSVRTAKSCPFSCSFCGFPQRAGTYLYLDVATIEEEFNRLKDQGVDTLTILDDTFNVPKNRFKDILEMMIRNKYSFKWNSFFRCDFGDEEIIDLMAQSGCEGVFLGLESGSDVVLKSMNKSLRRKHIEKMVPLLKASGIVTNTSFVVGFPGETKETFMETMEVIERVAPDYFRTQLWYCDPMTPIWQEREQWEIEGAFFNWSHKTMAYAEACELIDYAFLNIRNSIWLPQDSFEMWSLFYLQRKGFVRQQIDDFLQIFRLAIAKQKLLDAGPYDTTNEVKQLQKVISRYDEWAGINSHFNFNKEIKPFLGQKMVV